jgi:hypothetical protein
MNIAPSKFLTQSTAAYEAKVLHYGRGISPYPEALSTVRHVTDRRPGYLSYANTTAINAFGAELLSALPAIVRSVGNPSYYSKIRVFLPWMAFRYKHRTEFDLVMFDEGIDVARMPLSNDVYMGLIKPRVGYDQTVSRRDMVIVEELHLLAFNFRQADFDAIFGNIETLSRRWHYPAMAAISQHEISCLEEEVTRLILPENCSFNLPADPQDGLKVAPSHHDRDLRELSPLEVYQLAHSLGRRSFRSSFFRNGAIKAIVDEALDNASSELD